MKHVLRLLLLVAVVPLMLHLPMWAAEAPPADAAPPSAAEAPPAADAAEDDDADAAAPRTPAPDPGDELSLDNNVSFPVDI